jgi:hypothetical protein
VDVLVGPVAGQALAAGPVEGRVLPLEPPIAATGLSQRKGLYDE